MDFKSHVYEETDTLKPPSLKLKNHLAHFKKLTSLQTSHSKFPTIQSPKAETGVTYKSQLDWL